MLTMRILTFYSAMFLSYTTKYDNTGSKSHSSTRAETSRIPYINCMFHSDSNILADFRLSRWLIMDGNYDFGLLKGENVGYAADVSGVHATSTFRIEVCRVVIFYIYRGCTI